LLHAEAIHVPFRGSAPAQIELLAGNVGFMIDNLTGVIEHIRGGKLRALAVTGAERNAGLPDVPAARETLPELARFEVNTWFGLFGPAGLPEAIRDRLSACLRDAPLDPEISQRLIDTGLEPAPLPAAEFRRFIEAEIAKWTEVGRAAGIVL
jgi:tripartite-type tricarboxylate transporter receptor subunit TctC